MDNTINPLWTDYIRVLRHYVVPALGCTEPIAVALASAQCRELPGKMPQRITVWVSPNVYKNGMGVGIPGTGMIGLPAAAAIGAVAGDPNAGLQVLRDVQPEHVPAARALCDSIIVTVKEVDDPLYAEVLAEVGSETARVVICHQHTCVILKEHNGKEVYRRGSNSDNSPAAAMPPMTLDGLVDFATNVPAREIAFMLDAVELNSTLSEKGRSRKYGLKIGATLYDQVQEGMLSDDLMTLAMRLSSTASDARMDGAMLPAMSNSGSGNQGIAATMPVMAATRVVKASTEQIIRAITLSDRLRMIVSARGGVIQARMWTRENRGRMAEIARKTKRYPSDLTDEA